MKFGVLATLGRERPCLNQPVERVGQNLERGAPASARLVRRSRLGEVVWHRERCTEQARLFPCEGEVAGAHGAQPLPGIRLLAPGDGDGCQCFLHAIRRQPLRRCRYRVEERLSIGEVPVRGVGRDGAASGGFAKYDGVWSAFSGHFDAGMKEGLAKAAVMVLLACWCHLAAPSGRRPAIVPLWTAYTFQIDEREDVVFATTPAFSSFSVDDLDAARHFYSETLGLAVSDSEMGTLNITLGGGATIFVYPKPNHEPASFTVLNFDVSDIDAAVAELNARGVSTTIYGAEEVPGMPTDAQGIARDDEHEMAIAWFRDPAGNVMAAMQTS